MKKAAVSGAVAGAIALSGGALMTYAVRGRSARIFGPSVYRGPGNRPVIALTFDDGPSEGTLPLLDLLDELAIKATFFQIGANVRRLPESARLVLCRGHEIGNHSETHPPLYLRSEETIFREFETAQRSIEEVTGFAPRLMRAPLGCRWFGFTAMQRRLNLLGVMWSVIGRDWKLDSSAIADRVLRAAHNGSIVCLHDGRELQARPDIRSTLGAVQRIVPVLRHRGYRFVTVSQLFGLN